MQQQPQQQQQDVTIVIPIADGVPLDPRTDVGKLENIIEQVQIALVKGSQAMPVPIVRAVIAGYLDTPPDSEGVTHLYDKLVLSDYTSIDTGHVFIETTMQLLNMASPETLGKLDKMVADAIIAARAEFQAAHQPPMPEGMKAVN